MYRWLLLPILIPFILQPAKQEYHMRKAGTLRKLKKYNEAAVECQKACMPFMSNDAPHFLAGIVYYRANKYDKSAIEFEKAIELRPHIAELHNNLANAYSKLGLKERKFLALAKREFNIALALNPNYSQAYNNMGNVYYQEKRYEVAMVYFLKAIEMSPGYAEPHNNLANTYLQKGRVKEAIDEYKKALKLNPKYTEAKHNLNNVLKQLKRREVKK